MTDPIRWRDDPTADPEMVALLRSGSEPPPMSSATDARLAAAISALPAAPSTLARWRWPLLSVVGTAAILVVLWASQPSLTAPAPAAALPDEEPPASVTSSPLPSAPPSLPIEPIAPAAPHRAARPAPIEDPLEVEARLIGTAQRELDRAHLDRARALLDEHERRFPDGQLANERAILRARLAQ
jgi:hypothetical protein